MKRYRLVYAVPFTSTIRAYSAEHAKQIFNDAVKDITHPEAPGEASSLGYKHTLIACEELPEDSNG